MQKTNMNHYNFDINIFKGVPIINSEESIILIDTGAPSTIHTANSLIFCENDYECNTGYMGLTLSEISDMLGTEITTLLGADIIAEHNVLFDYRNNQVVFSKQEIELNGEEINISNFRGIPIIQLLINDQLVKFLLDTGANISYLPSTIVRNHKSVGIQPDFHPLIGRYEIECFEILTNIGSASFVGKYGVLPPILQTALIPDGVDGVIGHDFFKNFKVLLDIKREKLMYLE